VLTASFQLSFSAAGALIASYEWGSGWLARSPKRAGFGLGSIVLYFSAVMGASLVAWLATDPFIIYHFNQFSSYSLLANTIAEPLVSFILMPLVIAGVLLLPFHLAWIAFTPMQYGVDLLLAIAHWVARMPHAMWILPGPTDDGFALLVLGIVWMYFFKTRLRWCGMFFALAGFSTAFFYVPADVFISDDGKRVAVRTDDGQLAMVRGRATSVGAQQWSRASIEQDFENPQDTPTSCDRLGCIVTLKTHTLAVLKRPEALSEDCHMADIVILPQKVAKDSCKAAIVIDQTELHDSGGMTLQFKDGHVITRKVAQAQGKRPWAMLGIENENEP